MDFSERLKALRKKKGLTQEELAKRLFISRSVIAKYECGKSLPTRENAEKLAAFFDIKLSDLIEEEQVRMRSSEFRMRKNIAYILSFTGIFIDAFYLILFFIPVFFRRVYVYPIPDGSDRPSSVWESNSILTATLKNGNPIGILTFVFCVADLLLLLCLLIALRRKEIALKLEFASVLLLVIDVFLIFLTIALSASYAL